jgi:hypothetical protein
MKKLSIACLALLVTTICINPAIGAENFKASSYIAFVGPDGKDYSLTSTSAGLEIGEDVLSVSIAHFETMEEAQNALLITFRKALERKFKALAESSTFFTEFSKTRNGKLNLSLTRSFMRTSKGDKVHADIYLFYPIALAPQPKK